MTEEKLQAIKKQLSALVPATWTPVAIWSDDGTTISAVGPQRTNEDDAVRDAYFIAYAPTNMAELVRALEDARAKLAAVPVWAIAMLRTEATDECWEAWAREEGGEPSEALNVVDGWLKKVTP